MFDCSSTTHSSSTCPHCGGYLGNDLFAVLASDTYTTAPIFDYTYPEGLMPSCGYWPHHLHERFVKEVVKPIDLIKLKPIICRKQFMQLKTFKNLRF